MFAVAQCMTVLVAGVLRGNGKRPWWECRTRERNVAEVGGRAGSGNQVCSLFQSRCGATGRHTGGQGRMPIGSRDLEITRDPVSLAREEEWGSPWVGHPGTGALLPTVLTPHSGPYGPAF